MSGKSPGPEAPADHLRRRISQDGSIGFDEFMAVALYHPHGGYYSSGEPRTGRRGDFFTSVSVGPVFGKLLASQFAAMRNELGSPDDFTLVEQGANDGQLLADILTAWPDRPPRVVIVEPMENLRERQLRTLGPWSTMLTHVAHESELPPFSGVFFANELLDAFPVKIVVHEHRHWLERRVGHDGHRFVFVEEPLTDDTLPRPPVPDSLPRFTTEVCPGLVPWMKHLASRLVRGWIFLVDYGHPSAVRHHPARAAGSLAAFRSHQRQEDPLADPGSQDLTAHLDFTAVARAGMDCGLTLAGFTDQHHALAALAARVFPGMATQPLTADEAREMRSLRQLLHPESMGTSFKFLTLAKGIDTPLDAFTFARDPHRELFP